MIIDLQQSEDGAEGHATFPLFGVTIELLVNGDVERQYVIQCLQALDALSGDLLDSLIAASRRFREASRRGIHSLKPPARDNMMNHVTPIGVTIWPPEGPGMAFSLEFNCDWSPEDGMEWYIRDTAAVYVGPTQGESPWDDSSSWSVNYVPN